MRTAQITDTLYLTEIPVKADAPTVKVNKAKNNIWIFDRSGSMSWEIRKVVADMIDRVKHLPEGDTLTVGWFSSENGQFGWIVKGLSITDAKSRESAGAILGRYASTVGCTCFSEILTDLNVVLGDLRPLSPNFALMFFSDGYPIVSNYRQELKDIERAIADVAGTLNTVLLVGYGDYYNRELMGQMAEQFGGGLIHSSNLQAFSAAFEKFVNEASDVQTRLPVQIPWQGADKWLAVFSVTGSQITVYQPDEKGQVLFSPTGQDDYLYVLQTIDTDKTIRLGKRTDLAELERGAYAAAYVMSQRMKADLSLEILGKLGDVALIDSLNSAYTNDEAGKAEQAILAATTSPSWRYRGGRNPKYLPDPNAFCVLDALDMLTEDEASRFYPNHDAFVYKRIGRPSVVKGDFPKFEADAVASSPLNMLTWHDEKLNVSIKTSLEGNVHLRGEYANHGFGPVFRATRFRDFSIIADGVLNVSALPVSLGFATFEKFKAEGLIDSDEWRPEAVYVVHLDRLPIINRGMANGLTSATRLCRDILTELALEGQLKALKFLREEKDPDKTILRKTTYTAEQEAFLKENGLDTQGRYAPPTERGEATDWYMAKHFRVMAKGFSSLPSIKDVRDKMDKGKNQTVSGQLVLEGLAMFEQMAPHTSVIEELAWLDGAIADTLAALRKLLKGIQRTKFAILLGRKWFDEFASRDEKTITVDDVLFTIEVTEKKTEI